MSTGLYGTGQADSALRERFRNGDVTVAVYGLGKIGLPLAAVYADMSGDVVGVDVDESVVRTINGGDCHVDREPGLPALVERLIDEGRLRATTEMGEAATEASVHVAIVPTVVDEEKVPDLSALTGLVKSIGGGFDPGDVLFVECTVPPRTTVDRLVPILERESGYSMGDFGAAVCPERTSSGRALQDIRGAYPKIVGGVDPESTRVATAVYEELVENTVIPVSDATTAEAVKVFEGLYRDVNIGLANELATFTDEFGISVNEAIDAANTQPFCDIHRPGAGVGGHCIPYYPYFVIEPFDTDARLLRTARLVNDAMPGYAVGLLRKGFESTGRSLAVSTVAVLGITYRPGVRETRATPAAPIADELAASGADVLLVDPVLDEEALAAFAGRPLAVESLPDAGIDGAILVTAYEEFEAIRWDGFDQELVIVDGRGALPRDVSRRVYTIGGPIRPVGEENDPV
jgi:UDP-N-acetyl-D-mannosaminuronic acid dehydrogenase